MYTGARLSVDAAAIAGNTRRIAARLDPAAPGGRAALLAVVKADGFGHGAAALAALDAGATWLGVTGIAEALPLRWRGVAAPVLSWLNPLDAPFDEALLHDIDLAVPSVEHLQAIRDAAVRTGRAARIHLHLDTGMARDGASPALWSTLCELAHLAEGAGQVRVAGIMSHLARADEPGDPETTQQILLFRNALRAARHRGLRPQVAHLAATSAAVSDPRTHFGMVRIGAGLYGIDPTGTLTGADALRGAMTLTAPVVSVRDVGPGTGVGYGLRYRTERAGRLALVPLGYADGIPRGLPAEARVSVRGRRAPIAGTVSMDQLVLDVGDLGVEPGEVVTVFGPGDAGEPTLREWAGWAGTIEHELVTRIGPRVARQTTGLESARPELPEPTAPVPLHPGRGRTRGVAA